MNITVIHTLSPEILNLLQGFMNNQNGGSVHVAAPAKVKALKAEPPVTTDTATSKEEIKLEEVRALVNAKKDTHRVAIKALLTEFGAEKVTELDKNKYADFMAKVNAL